MKSKLIIVILISLLAISNMAFAGPDLILCHEPYGGGIWTMNPDGTQLKEISHFGWFGEFSRDGEKIAFGEYYLDGIWTMRPNGKDIIQLTESGGKPSWSPDGTQLVFVTGDTTSISRRLWIINADGSGLRLLIDEPADQPDWARYSDKIVYTSYYGGIRVINSDGSGNTILSTMGSHPSWSQDDSKIVYSNGKIHTMNPDGTDVTNISTSSGLTSSMGPDGSIAFESNNSVIVVDTAGIETTIATGRLAPDWSSGPTKPLVAKIDTPSSDITIAQGASVNFTCSVISGPRPCLFWWDFKSMGSSTLEDPGSIIFNTPGVYEVVVYVRDSLGNIVWDTVTVTVTASGTASEPPNLILCHAPYGGGIWTMNPDGTNLKEISDFGWFGAFSKDGQKIAFGEYYHNGIWTMNLDGTNKVKLTDFGSDPSWSPDGTQLVFVTGGTSAVNRRLWVVNTDGSGLRLLIDQQADEPDWARYSNKIIYTGDFGLIHVINSDGSGDTTLSTQGYAPSWSQDDGKIVYSNGKIYTMNPDETAATTASTSSGRTNSMGPDGSIAFESNNSIILVDNTGIETTIATGKLGPDWSSGPTKPLVAKIDTPSSDITIAQGASVDFSCSVISGPRPSIFWWDFKSVGNSFLEDPGSITFSTPGVYEVVVYVGDSLGNIVWDTVTVTVTPGAGALSVTIDTPASSIVIINGVSVNFSCTASGGSPSYTYWWDFKSVGNSSLEDPGSITFTTSGVYEVVAYVRDGLGNIVWDMVTITVTAF